ncbi:MAG: insulinase family protein [Candidatus Cloacimonetes bacterium]|nr:insulinase family protein [Candidatus Cloacimonadota bacterium]
MTDRFARTDVGDGLVVLTESMPGLRSASIGIWVRAGSVHETPELMGASHMLEHMVFKGTTRRSARDLALVLERVGGSLDAYTTREHTCYQAKVLDENTELALDVLADLVMSPLLRPEDLELEREVVLEEIATVEDTPDDLIFDLHAEQLWGDHPYGYSILGTRETVSSFTDDTLRGLHRSAYNRNNIIVAAVGNVSHEHIVEQVERLLGPLPAGNAQRNGRKPEAERAAELHVERPGAQSHTVFGTRTFGHQDPRRIALVLLSNAFGGGMSSRLFQRVREELGLAYAVYSLQSFYRDAGVSSIYVGTRPEWADRAEAVIREEMAKLAREGLTAEELEDAKGQVRGQVVLSMESSGARLSRLAGTELYDEPFRSVEEVLALVDAVTQDDVAALAATYYDPDRQVVLRLGPAGSRN